MKMTQARYDRIAAKVASNLYSDANVSRMKAKLADAEIVELVVANRSSLRANHNP